MFKLLETRRFALLALVLFHALVLAAPASRAATVVLPGPPNTLSSLQHDRARSAQTGRIELTGQAELTGLLQAYWVRAWPDGETEHRTLFMRFFLDADSRARLPSIRSEGGDISTPSVIQLYRGDVPAGEIFETAFPLETAIPLLDEAFDAVAPEFFRYREGFALAPVRLRLQHLSSFIECDRRLFFGGFSAIARSRTASPGSREQAEVLAAQLEAGCGAHAPYLEFYQIEAAAPGEPIPLHAAPTPDSPVVSRLAAGSQVLKLRTVNDEWVEVQYLDGGFTSSLSPPARPSPHSKPQVTPALRGYLPKRALQVIN